MMNDWQKVVYHNFGVDLTQKNWGLTFIKNLLKSIFYLALFFLLCGVIQYFLGIEWLIGILVIGAFYLANKK